MVATPLPMLPFVDEAERERHERRLERDRRRREQGQQAYFESEARPNPQPPHEESAENSTMVLRPSRESGILAGLEADALDSEGMPTQSAGLVSPALAEETPASTRGLARSGVIFAFATGVSRVVGLVREIAQAAVFGIKGPVNAFEIAFLVPNTVRALVADSALSAA